MNIFDSHTHFFGREFFEFQTSLVPGGDRTELLERIRAGGIEVPDENWREHRDRILADMDRHGVTRAVMFASAPPEMQSVGEAASGSDGRLVPFVMINPRIPAAIQLLDTVQPRWNFRGMVLFPAAGDYDIGEPLAAPALDAARRHKMLVFVHCGLLRVPVRELIGLAPDFPMERSHPKDILPIAAARSDQNFIVPHFGAGLFNELLELGESCPNVYTDTAGSNKWVDELDMSLAEVFAQTREVFGIERILFGSDSGFYPRGYRGDILEMQKAAMTEAGFSAEDQAAVLGGNLSRLLDSA